MVGSELDHMGLYRAERVPAINGVQRDSNSGLGDAADVWGMLIGDGASSAGSRGIAQCGTPPVKSERSTTRKCVDVVGWIGCWICERTKPLRLLASGLLTCRRAVLEPLWRVRSLL